MIPGQADSTAAARRGQGSSVELGGDSLRRLERLLSAGLKRARSTGAVTLVSATGRTDPDTDPTAVVAASRRAGEEWFCFEQPDRDR